MNYPSTMDSFNTEAMKLAAQGVTITVSAGDNGVSGDNCACTEPSGSSYTLWGGENTWTGQGYFPSFPATSPYVTAVGGTMGPNYGSPEVVCEGTEQGVITSGGGFSTYYKAPSFQSDAVNSYFTSVTTQPAAGYNRAGRAYPDVAMLATNYPVVIGGSLTELYGTSASSPLFAAFVSLVNSERYANGLPSLGWLNPTLYSASSSYYNDVTSGDNSCCIDGDGCCVSGFYASPGWDPATGFGSIDYPKLAQMFGTTANNYPTGAPTAANMPSNPPTPAPTYPPTPVAYTVMEFFNKANCEGSSSTIMIKGSAIGACVAFDTPEIGSGSYIQSILQSDLYIYRSISLYNTDDCSGPVIFAENNGLMGKLCTQFGQNLFASAYVSTETEPWQGFTGFGALELEYDTQAACLDSTNITLPVSTFNWVQSGGCLGKEKVVCNSDGSFTWTAYSQINCQTPTGSQTFQPSTCESIDNSGYESYYFDPSILAVAETSYCIGSADTNSNDDLSGGEIAGIVIGSIFGIAVLVSVVVGFVYYRAAIMSACGFTKTTDKAVLLQQQQY